jgi:hypothetical protein
MSHEFARLGIVLSVSVTGIAQTDGKQEGSARPRVSSSVVDPQEVRVLRLHPGYATSLRMPEEISSVVIGNPALLSPKKSRRITSSRTIKLMPYIPCRHLKMKPQVLNAQ